MKNVAVTLVRKRINLTIIIIHFNNSNGKLYGKLTPLVEQISLPLSLFISFYLFLILFLPLSFGLFAFFFLFSLSRSFYFPYTIYTENTLV